jgi:hypothetical protein
MPENAFYSATEKVSVGPTGGLVPRPKITFLIQHFLQETKS